MKGVVKCFGLFSLLLTIFGLSLSVSLDANAASLDTSIYNVWYRRYANESFTRLSDIGNGYSNGFNATALRWYEFKSVPVTATGQYASLHFETNIVYSRGANQQGGIGEYNFVNGTYMNTMRCWFGSTRLRIISQSLSFSSTPWRGTSPSGIPVENITRTWYGDVSLADIPLNVTDNIICEIGNDQFNMFDTTVGSPNLLYIPWLWFEQNPADITFTYSATESQLGGLSEQQQVIIQQNQEMIDRDNEDRERLESIQDDAESDAESAGEDVEAAGTRLLDFLTTFYGYIINPPQSDCIIDGDLGRMDLGDIDLCQLSLPQPIQVISSLLLIGVLIPFVISAVNTLIRLIKEALA